jgi:hypothetical protein
VNHFRNQKKETNEVKQWPSPDRAWRMAWEPRLAQQATMAASGSPRPFSVELLLLTAWAVWVTLHKHRPARIATASTSVHPSPQKKKVHLFFLRNTVNFVLLL